MNVLKLYYDIIGVLNQVTKNVVTRGGKIILAFLDLKDTPTTYASKANYIVNVNAGETALEFDSPSAIGATINHNDLANKQGGETDEYYHLTNEAYRGTIGWYEATGITTMNVMKGYIANNISQVPFTLPSTGAVGDVVAVAGKGAGGWRINQNAGQTIHSGYISSLTGTGGYIESINYLDGVTLLCITTNTDWKLIWSNGNLSINIS